MGQGSDILFALVVAGATVAGCSSDHPPAERPRPRAPDTAALDRYFRGQFAADEPGGAVLVSRNDQVVFSGAYGLADLRTREPVTTRTLFNVGSITKTFVANAILILQEEGKLSVDDGLSKYFELKHPEVAARVSLRHLLTHTSGLPDAREVDENPSFFLTAKDEENWFPITQVDALEFEPGSRSHYSNPAFNGLALIVQKTSGQRWQSFVRDRIFLPSGMKTSTITDGPHPSTGVAHSYTRVNGDWVEQDYGEVPTFAAAGNGGVWSSVDELALYERAIRRATFLSRAAIADSRTVKTFANWTAPEPPMFGWAWMIERPEGVLHVGHTGTQGGFHSIYVTIPDQGIFYVVLASSPRDREAFAAEIEQWLRRQGWLEAEPGR